MDKRIREAIEACRAGSEDLHASEMSDVARAVSDDAQVRLAFERLQAWDAAMGDAMPRIEVPADLEARILARLESAGAGNRLGDAISAATTAASSSDDHVVSLAPAKTNWSRRHWIGAAGLGLSAAALVIAAGFWLNQGSDLPLELLADRWQAELGAKWESPNRVPNDFPPAEAIRIQPARWQWIGRFTPTPVVAYELVDPMAGKAMLYVTRMSRAGLPGALPLSPQWNSGGQTVGYWHVGDKVYVLVVPNERTYRAFVRPATAPLA